MHPVLKLRLKTSYFDNMMSRSLDDLSKRCSKMINAKRTERFPQNVKKIQFLAEKFSSCEKSKKDHRKEIVLLGFITDFI